MYTETFQYLFNNSLKFLLFSESKLFTNNSLSTNIQQITLKWNNSLPLKAVKKKEKKKTFTKDIFEREVVEKVFHTRNY